MHRSIAQVWDLTTGLPDSAPLSDHEIWFVKLLGKPRQATSARSWFDWALASRATTKVSRPCRRGRGRLGSPERAQARGAAAVPFIAPSEIQNTKLGAALRGYDREETDALLAQVKASYERVWERTRGAAGRSHAPPGAGSRERSASGRARADRARARRAEGSRSAAARGTRLGRADDREAQGRRARRGRADGQASTEARGRAEHEGRERARSARARARGARGDDEAGEGTMPRASSRRRSKQSSVPTR